MTDLETAARAALEALRAHRQCTCTPDSTRCEETRVRREFCRAAQTTAAIAALEAALAAPVSPLGSTLDQFLDEEGIREEVYAGFAPQCHQNLQLSRTSGTEKLDYGDEADGAGSIDIMPDPAAIRRAALEEAARIADAYAEANKEYGAVSLSALPAIAFEIRALADKEQTDAE